MTKSTMTREESVQAVFDLKVGYRLGFADIEILKRVARMALAAMDSEPVVQPVMFIDGDISSDDADKLAKIIREFNEEDERPLAKMARIIRENPHPTNECDMPKAQPAPVVPTFDEWLEIRGSKPLGWVKDAMRESYDACRAAMLQAEPVTTANKLGNSPAIPDTWIPVSERMPEGEQEVLTINRMGHRFVSLFDKHSGLFFDRLDAPSACCIEHVLVTHWMELPAAPQEVMSARVHPARNE